MPFSYDDAVATLGDALRFGTNPSLDTITALCEALGRPQDALRAIQVAGTNGKTSVTWMTEAILSASGMRAASYTSPHLSRYTERIRLDGTDCSAEEFAAALETVLIASRDAGLNEPTEFEILTAAALWLFGERGVDVAVLEVGMGGRWDATSVVAPEVAVVTGVGLDHIEHLGDTREMIAAEKACVIKQGTAVVLGPGTEGVESIFEERALQVGASAVRIGPDAGADSDFALPARMPGYQSVNAVMARAAAEALIGEPVRASTITDALAGLALPARFEQISAEPPLIVDGSHNPQAAEVLAGAIERRFATPPTIVLAVLDDKDAAGIIDALWPAASRLVVTRSESARALEVVDLAAIVAERTGVSPRTFATLSEALDALAGEVSSGIVVTGSLTIAAEAREAVLGT